MLYDYPKQTQFGKVIPKSKIYEHGSINTAIKDKFISQIDKIVWSHKLASETLNLEASKNVPEIQVFDIHLKGKELEEELLKVVDKTIPFPIIYQIHQNGKIKVKAAYKRPSESDNSKWVTESYFESDWLSSDTSKTPLPVVLNLNKLYEAILYSLMPEEVQTSVHSTSLKDQIERIDVIQAKEREYKKLNARRNKEKQFNRKVEMNKQLKELKKEIELLKKGEI